MYCIKNKKYISLSNDNYKLHYTISFSNNIFNYTSADLYNRIKIHHF